LDWILLISLQWVVMGSPVPPATRQIGPFESELLCNKAAEAVRIEMNTPIPGQRVQTFVKVVCMEMKEPAK
jgi:hypothetical protein